MIKLIYFKMRALAEAPQILRRCYDIDYEYMGKEDGCCRIAYCEEYAHDCADDF